jgi:hypothetical protein
MATDTATFDAALKEYYGPAIEKALNEEVPLFDALTEAGSEAKISGSKLVWPVHTKISGGVGAIGEGTTLPTAGNQTRSKASVEAKELYGRISLTNKVMASSRGEKSAFVDALDAEMQDLSAELKRSLNRQLYGNKSTPATNTGILAVASNTGGGGTKVLTVDGPGTHHLRSGMKILLGTDAEQDPALAGSPTAAVIDTVDSRTQVTLTENTAWTDDDLVVIGDANFTSYKQELTGLEFLVDDTDGETVQGISSDLTAWRAFKSDNAGVNRNLSHELMDAMFDAINERSGKHANFVVGHQSAVREVKKLMEGDVRYVPLVFKGGFKRSMLTWNNGKEDIPIVADRYCQTNKLFFLDLSAIKIGYLQKFRWLDDDGAILSRVSNQATFEAAYGSMLELLVTRRNSHGQLADISINTSTLITPV